MWNVAVGPHAPKIFHSSESSVACGPWSSMHHVHLQIGPYSQIWENDTFEWSCSSLKGLLLCFVIIVGSGDFIHDGFFHYESPLPRHLFVGYCFAKSILSTSNVLTMVQVAEIAARRVAAHSLISWYHLVFSSRWESSGRLPRNFQKLSAGHQESRQ